MKVGIVTVHDSSNLGSFLQSLGMQELVKQNGDTPYFIRTRSKFTTLCLYLGYNNSRSVRSVKSFLRFCIKSIMHTKQTMSRYKKYRVYKKDWGAYENIFSFKHAGRVGLDALLLGSDEIWNVNQPAFQNPLLFGIGIPAKKKVAYAISMGNATKEDLSQFSNLREGIAKLDAILNRDERTRKVIEAFGLRVDARICDPTIQVDIRNYMKAVDEVDLPAKDYIAVYAYSVDVKRKNWIQHFAREHHLKTVAVSLPQEWCDEYLNCSPLEFGAVLHQAKYVYTTTFHGTIFSALYHTQFIVDPVAPKIVDVLKLLGLESRQLNSEDNYESFCALLTQVHDYDQVEKRIDAQRKESIGLYQKYVKGI